MVITTYCKLCGDYHVVANFEWQTSLCAFSWYQWEDETQSFTLNNNTINLAAALCVKLYNILISALSVHML